MRFAAADIHLSADLHQAKELKLQCVHDNWRFGRHLLYPAFCLLRHHADTKDTTSICLDNTEPGVRARRKGEKSQ